MNSKKLTVGFFSPGWPLASYPNGIVSYVENIVGGFDKALVDSVVFSEATDSKEDRVVDVSKFAMSHIGDRLVDSILYRTSTMDAFRQSMGRRVARAVKITAPAIDILEMEESFGASSLVAKNLNIPVVTRLHGPWFLMGDVLGVDKNRSFKRRVQLEGDALKKAVAITSPCQVLLDQVREFYKLDLTDARVIPNPAPYIADAKCLWRAENCVEKVMLFVGRFDRHKGGDLVIDAFRLIAAQDKDVCLHFVGPDRGLLNNGVLISLPQYIEQTIQDVSIRARIKVLGQQNAEEIRLHRRTALVTVIASRYENFPMTLLEAISLGCPVVATAVGGIKEVIKDGINGLLVERVQAENLAEKVFELLNNHSLRESLSQNALEDCAANFQPSVVAHHTLEFYKSVIASQS